MYSTQRSLAITLLACVICMVVSNQAVMTKAESTILFADDFEDASEVAGDIGDLLDADPVATVGTWDITEKRDGEPVTDLSQVTNSPVPGPVEGSNYFRLQRPQVVSEVSSASANFSNTQSGGTLDISYAMNLDMLQPFRTYAKVQNGSEQRCRYWVETKEDSTAEVWYGTASGEIFTGLNFSVDEWVQFDVNVDLSKNVYSLSLSGGSGINGTAANIPFYAPGNTANSLLFQTGRYTNCYYDDVSITYTPHVVTFPVGQSQLFVDDATIAFRSGLVRTAHPCKKLDQPVFEAEMPWETDGWDKRVYLYGTVLYDEAQSQFRMWYMDMVDGTGQVLYATSQDGLNWQRPELGLFEFNGSTANNILPIGFKSASVIYDEFETDDAKRYKMAGKGNGYEAAYSSDGLNWTKYPGTIAFTGDTCTLAQNPETGEYLFFHKHSHEYLGEERRLVYLSTSMDMVNWSTPELVMAPDAFDDSQTQAEGGLYSQFYNMSAFNQGGQFLGLVTHFHYMGAPEETGPGQSGSDGPIDVQIVSSRDGYNWDRCEDRSPVIPTGPYDYDAGCILGVTNGPVNVGDEQWFYYTAVTTTHGGYLPDKEMSIARAVWRRDGFVSLDADESGGELITVPFKLTAGQLTINAITEMDGFVLAELLDEEGNVIIGYDSSASSVFIGDSLSGSIMWSGRSISEDLIGEIVQLRFLLNDACLYSFSIIEALTPGDANGDGKVDGSDVTILAGNWQHGVGMTTPNATWAMGDFNADGCVDGSDVSILAGNWQYSVTVRTNAVPEPDGAASLLALLLTTGFTGHKRSFMRS